MAIVIDELTTTLEIADEAKIRKLVHEEVKRAMAGQGPGREGTTAQVDARDPNAADAGGH